MKRIIRNITSAFALVALAASCSNSEIDELNNQQNLPLSFSAEVSQTVSRAETQSVQIGEITEGIVFDMTLGENTKSMLLKSNGVIAYSAEADKFTVNSVNDKPALSPLTIDNVPLTFNRDGIDFSFNATLANATESLDVTGKVVENVMVASTVIPMKVNCSGLYIKVNETVADNSYISFNNEEYPLVSSEKGFAACFIKLESSASLISTDTYFALLTSGDKIYKLKVSTEINPSTNSLYVLDVPQALSRTMSGQNAIYVIPAIENW